MTNEIENRLLDIDLASLARWTFAPSPATWEDPAPGLNRCPAGGPTMTTAAHLWAVGYDQSRPAQAQQIMP